jgi:hypothetical protein
MMDGASANCRALFEIEPGFELIHDLTKAPQCLAQSNLRIQAARKFRQGCMARDATFAAESKVILVRCESSLNKFDEVPCSCAILIAVPTFILRSLTLKGRQGCYGTVALFCVSSATRIF